MSASAPRTLDVSTLPGYAFDSRAPVWWGNTLMIVIESTTVALLLVFYYYTWAKAAEWPPPLVDTIPPDKDPVPYVGFGTANFVLLALSCFLMWRTDQAARQRREAAVKAGLLLL